MCRCGSAGVTMVTDGGMIQGGRERDYGKQQSYITTASAMEGHTQVWEVLGGLCSSACLRLTFIRFNTLSISAVNNCSSVLIIAIHLLYVIID